MILAKCARNGLQFAISLADFTEVFQAELILKRLREGLMTKRFTRGLPYRRHAQSDLSIADFLKEMAKRGSIQVSAADSQEFKAGARTAYLRGWVHKIVDNDTEVYIFASPVHRWYCPPDVSYTKHIINFVQALPGAPPRLLIKQHQRRVPVGLGHRNHQVHEAMQICSPRSKPQPPLNLSAARRLVE